MALTFYWYPNCGSCKKAKKFLDENKLDYNSVHIVKETPTKAEILELISKSDLPAKKFFNTSGRVYRERNMKEVLIDSSIDEMATFLASDGMLIKRPIITDGEKVTVGFNEEVFKEAWL